MQVLLAVYVLLSAAPAVARCPTSEWVDPDTPAEVCATGKTDLSGAPLQLVFSDEFNVAGRSFQDGHDPKWTAVTGYPHSNEQVNAYVDSPEYASTKDGKLRLKASAVTSNMQYHNSTSFREVNLERAYASPMLQTWNKFCFTEGVIEMSAQLPGKATQGGLWPAFWLMGNLGRATAEKSTDKIWPFSYDHCPSEADSAANQFPADQQLINACRDEAWTEQYGLNPHQGRGAIELDIVEAMPGAFIFDYKTWKIDSGYCGNLSEADYSLLVSPRPMVATSLQLGPGIPRKADQRPLEADLKWGGKQKYNCVPENWNTQWYPELKQGNYSTYGKTYQSQPNVDFWGEYFRSQENGIDLQTDSLSSLNTLPNDAWTGQHVYTLDWKAGPDGWVSFQMDGEKQFHVDSSSVLGERNVTRNGTNLGTMLGRQMPEEPSYIMLNVDLARRWGWPDCDPKYCNCCADCRDKKCTTCYYPWQPKVNARQWLADLCTTLPAHYEIDYVRVWQRPSNIRTECSPKDYPTQGWIESHLDQYVLPNMNEALRPVHAGGNACKQDSECGGLERGSCADGACRCQADWTGPQCLVKRAGSSAKCQPLEDFVIGGAACDTELTSSCGALRGHGKCVLVARPGGEYAANQTVLMPDNKTWKMVGGGLGRCQCEEGWVGPSCTHPQGVDQCVPELFPDAAWMGSDLEGFIKRTCSRTTGWQANGLSVAQRTALDKACSEVQWKPHWMPGGNYSTCGSWPRALWIARALGCKKKEQTKGMDELLLWVFVGVSGSILFLGCAALACRRPKLMYGKGTVVAKPMSKDLENVRSVVAKAVWKSPKPILDGPDMDFESGGAVVVAEKAADLDESADLEKAMF